MLALIGASPASAVQSEAIVFASDGVITRDDLRDGLDQLVTDESIAAANSTPFRQARTVWSDDDQFVAQVDYQFDYRRRVDYLSTDPDYVAQLLTARPVNFGIETLGLYLWDGEVSEMERRAEIGNRQEDVVELLTGVDESDRGADGLPDYGPVFGGIFQDQMDGGVILLAVTDASLLDLGQLEAAVGGARNLNVIEQEFSYNETEAVKAGLAQALDRLGVGHEVTTVWSEKGRTVEVRVENPAALPSDFGSTLPEGSFLVARGEPVRDAGLPNSTHSLADQQPGLRVLVAMTDEEDNWCTWGFNAHTAGGHHIVMAGHCYEEAHKNENGEMGEVVNLWQNGSSSRNITPGGSVLKSIKNSSYDVSRIESTYANDNCHHTETGHCSFRMSSRANHSSWEEGVDQSCAALGMSADWRCGFVVAQNVNSDFTTKVGMNAIKGDSGSGMQWGNRIDGILNGITPGFVFFQTAQRVTAALAPNFSFNCHVGLLTTTDPSDWGTCPGVDA